MKKSRVFGIEKRAGVYRLQNLINGNFYIGSSRNLYMRFYTHREKFRHSTHDNIRIKEDLMKYGMSSFVFGVVEYCDESIMKEREQHYFETMHPKYNVWKSAYSAQGREYTEGQLKNFREMPKMKTHSEEAIKKLKEAWRKRKASMTPEELSAKMAKARTGIKHSEETKRLFSLKRKGKKKPPHFADLVRERRTGTKLIDGHYVKI